VQTTNLATVEVEANKSTTPTASANAVGSEAAPGSAPALARAGQSECDGTRVDRELVEVVGTGTQRDVRRFVGRDLVDRGSKHLVIAKRLYRIGGYAISAGKGTS